MSIVNFRYFRLYWKLHKNHPARSHRTESFHCRLHGVSTSNATIPKVKIQLAAGIIQIRGRLFICRVKPKSKAIRI